MISKCFKDGNPVTKRFSWILSCLLYTSDAADERSSVDLGGRRIIKKKKRLSVQWRSHDKKNTEIKQQS